VRHVIAIVILVGALLPTAAVRPAAAATPVDLSIASVDIRTGQELGGACYVVVDWSEEGCDENGDGRVDFKGVPLGHYTVTQTRAPAGYLAPGDFPIDVQVDSQIFGAFLAPKSQGGGSFDIAIRAIDQFQNEVLTGACFLLNGGSLEGCDENADGQVDFKGVRAGTYLVTETQPPDGYLAPDDFWIAVTAKGSRIFSVLTPEDRGQPNVSIGSIDDATGEYLVGACYIINGGSIEGCDENGDGWVDYRGVAPGTYTVTETRAPAGYAKVDDFTIVVKQSGEQDVPVRHRPGAAKVDVAIVSRDAATGERLAGACYIIDGGSIEGCDENGDGQVDFKGVIGGRYAVIETKAPAGYRTNLGLQFLFSEPADGGVQFVYVDHRT
jgi:uncharacterized surface anchored protein